MSLSYPVGLATAEPGAHRTARVSDTPYYGFQTSARLLYARRGSNGCARLKLSGYSCGVEAVVFCGIQASGKTTFYVQRYLGTHVRISLDVLRTRHRERLLLEACIAARQPFVVDNTNPTRRDRERYIAAAGQAGFRLVACLFCAHPGAAIARNEARTASERVPIRGVLGTHKRLEPPSTDEGFDELLAVTIGGDGRFCITPEPGPRA